MDRARREHTRWTYFPGSRPGVRVGELTDHQQQNLASGLLASSYGAYRLRRRADYWLRALGQPHSGGRGRGG